MVTDIRAKTFGKGWDIIVNWEVHSLPSEYRKVPKLTKRIVVWIHFPLIATQPRNHKWHSDVDGMTIWPEFTSKHDLFLDECYYTSFFVSFHVFFTSKRKFRCKHRLIRIYILLGLKENSNPNRIFREKDITHCSWTWIVIVRTI